MLTYSDRHAKKTEGGHDWKPNGDEVTGYLLKNHKTENHLSIKCLIWIHCFRPRFWHTPSVILHKQLDNENIYAYRLNLISIRVECYRSFPFYFSIIYIPYTITQSVILLLYYETRSSLIYRSMHCLLWTQNLLTIL